jgi:hypothetical protein
VEGLEILDEPALALVQRVGLISTTFVSRYSSG